MFNLESSIADWRRQMRTAGVKNLTDLDELENHLREDVARQMPSSLGAEEAFEAAARRIGEAHALKTEFAKSGRPAEAGRTRRESAWLVCLVGFILLLSGGTIWRTQLSVGGQVVAFTGVLFTLALAFGWRHIVALQTVVAVKHRVAAVAPACGFYLKAGSFLMPAAFFWFFSVIFLMPKLQEICRAAGSTAFNFPADAPAWFRGLADIGQGLVYLTAHAGFTGGLLVVALVILEWRSEGWKRYRRATVGTGIFVLNFAVLLSITLMVLSALLASTSLMSHPR